MNWKKSGLSLLLIAWLACWLGPGPASGQTPAETDSLVWYAEQLEFDLLVCEIRGAARADSLAVIVWGLEDRLAWAQEDRQRWWQSPGLMICVGVALGAAAAGLAFNLTGP